MSMFHSPERVILLNLHVCLRITRVLMRGSESGDVRMEGEVKRKIDSTLLALKMKGA